MANDIALSIIIPVLNGEPFIAETVARVFAWAKGLGQQIEIICINDGSQDNTLSALEAICGRDMRCSVINFSNNCGKGAAIREGLKNARGRYAVFTDADLPYGVDIFGRMLQIMQSNPDLALLYGSRSHESSKYEAGYGVLRKFGRNFFSYFIRLMVLPNVSDTQCGIKMLRVDFAKLAAEKLTVNRFAYDVELFVIADAHRLKYGDVPVTLNQSKESSVRLIKDTLIMIWDVARIKLRKMMGHYV